MTDKPNKVTAVLKVVVIGEFYDDDATEETLRYAVEQDLEDAGFDVDVALLKEQEAVKPEWSNGTPFCGNCGHRLEKKNRSTKGIKCPTCGKAVKWDAAD